MQVALAQNISSCKHCRIYFIAEVYFDIDIYLIFLWQMICSVQALNICFAISDFTRVTEASPHFHRLIVIKL